MRLVRWILVATLFGSWVVAEDDSHPKIFRAQDRTAVLIEPGEAIGAVKLGTTLTDMSRVGTSVSGDTAMGRVAETRLIPAGPQQKAEVLIYYPRPVRNADGTESQLANVIVTYSPDFILYPLTRVDGTILADEEPIRVNGGIVKAWEALSRNFHHLRYVTSQVDATEKQVDFYDDPDWGVGFHVDPKSGLIVAIYIFPPLAGPH
jgi:hypothetical protein